MIASTYISAWIARVTELISRQTGTLPAVRQLDGTAPEQGSKPLWWSCSDAERGVDLFVGAAETSWQALGQWLRSSVTEQRTHGAKADYLNFLRDSFGLGGGEITRAPRARDASCIEIEIPGEDPVRLQFVAEPRGSKSAASRGSLLDIELPVTMRLGKARRLLGELLEVKPGAVIEFDRRLNDPVELVVNGRMVARGEAVMVNGNYGIRITEARGE